MSNTKARARHRGSYRSSEWLTSTNHYSNSQTTTEKSRKSAELRMGTPNSGGASFVPVVPSSDRRPSDFYSEAPMGARRASAPTPAKTPSADFMFAAGTGLCICRQGKVAVHVASLVKHCHAPGSVITSTLDEQPRQEPFPLILRLSPLGGRQPPDAGRVSKCPPAECSPRCLFYCIAMTASSLSRTHINIDAYTYMLLFRSGCSRIFTLGVRHSPVLGRVSNCPKLHATRVCLY